MMSGFDKEFETLRFYADIAAKTRQEFESCTDPVAVKRLDDEVKMLDDEWRSGYLRERKNVVLKMRKLRQSGQRQASEQMLYRCDCAFYNVEPNNALFNLGRIVCGEYGVASIAICKARHRGAEPNNIEEALDYCRAIVSEAETLSDSRALEDVIVESADYFRRRAEAGIDKLDFGKLFEITTDICRHHDSTGTINTGIPKESRGEFVSALTFVPCVIIKVAGELRVCVPEPDLMIKLIEVGCNLKKRVRWIIDALPIASTTLREAWQHIYDLLNFDISKQSPRMMSFDACDEMLNCLDVAAEKTKDWMLKAGDAAGDTSNGENEGNANPAGAAGAPREESTLNFQKTVLDKLDAMRKIQDETRADTTFLAEDRRTRIKANKKRGKDNQSNGKGWDEDYNARCKQVAHNIKVAKNRVRDRLKEYPEKGRLDACRHVIKHFHKLSGATKYGKNESPLLNIKGEEMKPETLDEYCRKAGIGVRKKKK